MKRAARTLILVLLALAVNGVLTSAARADCGAELKAVKARLATVKDPHRREELQKLLDKAENDDKAGRAALCDAAVQHARNLLAAAE